MPWRDNVFPTGVFQVSRAEGLGVNVIKFHRHSFRSSVLHTGLQCEARVFIVEVIMGFKKRAEVRVQLANFFRRQTAQDQSVKLVLSDCELDAVRRAIQVARLPREEAGELRSGKRKLAQAAGVSQTVGVQRDDSVRPLKLDVKDPQPKFFAV